MTATRLGWRSRWIGLLALTAALGVVFSVTAQQVAPERPTGLTATPSHDQVALHWDDPGDESITGYQILRRLRDIDAPGVFAVLVEDTGEALTSYADRTVTPSTRYVYRVKASNAFGLSGRSSYANADTVASPIEVPAQVAPATPTGLTAAPAGDGVALSWDDPGDTSITGYQILRRLPDTDPPGVFAVLNEDTGEASTSFVDRAVTPGSRYEYQVKARNADRLSAPSSSANATTAAAVVQVIPPAPTGLSAEATADGVALSWDDPGDSSITGYQILRRLRDTDAPGVFAVLNEDTGDASTSFVDRAVTPGTRYIYRVKARNADGLSAQSSYARATAAELAVPGAPQPPTGLTAEATVDGVTLRWHDPGDASVTGYQILRRTVALDLPGHFTVLVEDTDATDVTYSDASVEPQTDYVYRVAAHNASGLSAQSSFVNVTTLRPPPISADTDPADLAPTNLRVEREHKLIRLDWDPPAARTDLVTGYQVLEEQVGDDGATRTVAIFVSLPQRTSFNYLPARLENGRRYSFQVTALRGQSVSLPSDTASLRVRAGTVRADQVDPSGVPLNDLSDLPAAPLGLGATLLNGQVRLAWIAPAAAQPATTYRVYREQLIEPVALVFPVRTFDEIAATSLADAQLEPGARYRYGLAVRHAADGKLSLASEPVVIDIPAALNGATPMLTRMHVAGAGPLAFQSQHHRYLLETTTSGQARVHLATNALDTYLHGTVIHADTFVPQAHDLTDPVQLSAAGDTLVLVRADSADGLQQTLYTLRLRPRATPAAASSSSYRGSGSLLQLFQDSGTDLVGSPQLRSEPRLSGIGLSSGELEPPFDRETFEYNVSVPPHVATLTVTPATGASGSWLITNDDADSADGRQVALNPITTRSTAETTVSIVVRSADRTRLDTYVLTVTRDGTSTDPALTALSTDPGSLYPAFSAETTDYTVFVGSDQAQLTISATAVAGATATISVTDADADESGHQVALEAGRNEITVTAAVTGGSSKTYNLAIVREPAMEADHEGFLQIERGWLTVCGLREDHTLVCSDDGEQFAAHVPEGIFVQVGISRLFGCALRQNGDKYCWWDNAPFLEQRGLDVERLEGSAEPVGGYCGLLPTGNIGCGPLWQHYEIEGPFTAMAQSRDGVCGLRPDGLARCFIIRYGHFYTRPHFQAGQNYLAIDPAYPDTAFSFISAGYGEACGIRESDNAALCWKWYIDHRRGSSLNRDIATLPTMAGQYKWIDAGIGARACGVLLDGTVNCWRNGESQSASNAPDEATIGYETVSLAHRASPCGLRTDGSMKCWTGWSSWSLNHTSPWRNSAELLRLQVSGATLSPAFDRAEIAYNTTVANEIESVTVSPELTNSLAVYTIYSDTDGAAGEDGVLNLSVGNNIIHVRVVSADRTATQTYTFTVTRESEQCSCLRVIAG